MAAQIHMAGSTWINVSRQLENSSFTPSNRMMTAPTASARGANSRRERLSRRTASSTVASSLSRTARASRRARSTVAARRPPRPVRPAPAPGASPADLGT